MIICEYLYFFIPLNLFKDSNNLKQNYNIAWYL